MHFGPGDLMPDYEFTTDWFQSVRDVWGRIVPQINPKRVVEVGSWEGASACFMIETMGAVHDLELHCIDMWSQGEGLDDYDMAQVEQRFLNNVKLAGEAVSHEVDLHIFKGTSEDGLLNLLPERKRAFDIVYVDGSHQASDVLSDAILAFKLVRRGGWIFFDDYLWSPAPTGDGRGIDLAWSPKPAIDAFTTMYWNKIRIQSGLPLYQLYVQKVTD
jgi:predicted O-methyltransferase YrrM